jgi:hypothetical protein
MVTEVAGILRQSGLFAEVHRPREISGDESVTIVVRPYERRPYYTIPSHNPGLVLLSPAIPLWWSSPFGYRFSASDSATGRTVEVDTRRTGTVVMWGLAPLLNLSETRALFEHPERELDHVRVQLLPLLSHDDTQPECARPGDQK